MIGEAGIGTRDTGLWEYGRHTVRLLYSLGIGKYVDLPNLGVAYCWRDRGLNSKGFELAERAGERSFGVWIKFGGQVVMWRGVLHCFFVRGHAV
jgi:hypothetical protein